MLVIPTSSPDFVALLAAHDNELELGDVPAGGRALWRRAIYALIHSDALPDGYCIKHTGRDHGDLTIRMALRAEEKVAPPPDPIPVPTRLVNPHPLIAATRAAAGTRKTGWIDTRRQAAMLHVNVTAGLLHRVLLIAQALVDEAGRRGHQVRTLDGYRCSGGLGIFVGIHGYEMVFAEETDRVEHEPTNAELVRAARSSWERIPRWDDLPSGRIQLRMGHSGTDRRLAGDRTRWKLDDRLGRALDTIETLAAAAEQRDQEARDREARVLVEWEAAKARAGVRYHEARRAEHLRDQLDRWKLAGEIRTFIAEAKGDGRCTSQSAGQEWLDWAAQYATTIDPLREPLAEPDEVEPTPDALVPYLDGWSPYGPTRARRWG